MREHHGDHLSLPLSHAAERRILADESIDPSWIHAVGDSMKSGSRLVAVGIAAVTILSASFLAASPAQAAPPTVPALELPAGISGDYSYFLEYGAVSPASRQIPIGPATTALQIYPPFYPQYELDCSLEDAGGAVVAERYWDEDEVRQPAPFVFVVPAGAITVPGGPYTVDCMSRSESTARAAWTMTVDAAAPASVVLNHAPEKETRETQYDPLNGGSLAWETPVSLGERLRLRGEVGIWFPAGSTYTLTTAISVLDDETGGGTAAGPAADVSATAAGDVLGLTLPASIPAEPGGAIGVSAIATSTVPGTSTTPEQVLERRWYSRLLVVEKAATQTSLRLDRTVALSGRTTVRAHVAVTAPAGEPVAGTVTVFVDGKASGQAAVSGSGTVASVVRLPRLKRGVHSVVAVFGSTDTLLGSTSASKSVRILL
ncbi:hypothetical protein ASF30_07930 [Leifsonia sp. Leaf264]|nr:hypothetical protein ASF30_07930 [Leifsonia sp. Leaf264]